MIVSMLAGVHAAGQTPPAAVTEDALAAEDAAGREVYQQVCGGCHETSLVEGPLRTPAEWDDTIDRMEAYGASGTAAQFEQIRAFLLRNYGQGNVNTAPATDLAPILNVTKQVAESVVTYRMANGPFKSIDDLKKAPGLYSAKLEARLARLRGSLHPAQTVDRPPHRGVRGLADVCA